MRLDPSVVAGAHEDLSARYDLVVVEAAGGALVPFSDGVDMAALAACSACPWWSPPGRAWAPSTTRS